MRSKGFMVAVVSVGLLLTGCETAPDTKAIKDAVTTDPLPSWNEGPTKKAIIDFVGQVTKEGGPNFVPVGDRIATFDNDGTLWVEQPIYTEVAFSLDRVGQMAPEHPDWKKKQPYAAVLNHDMKAVAAGGEKGLMQIVVATHTGMNEEDFEKTVSDWMATAKHPKFQTPYTQCVYQPMLEVLKYMRANGFKTFIVSGGEQGFMRPWTEKTYGIPKEQVVGTQLKSEFKDGELMRMPGLDSNDDGPGKPVNIGRFIGKRPIAAFGNSDGDQQMLEYTTAGPGPRLGVLVHHTDADREYAYDRDSKVGRLDKALDEAKTKQWVVIDMKIDWKSIFPAAAK